MKSIILLCAVSMAASYPVLEDTNLNWGIFEPPEPEYYDDDVNYDHRPITFDILTLKPRLKKSTTSTTTYRSIEPIPDEPTIIDVESIMKKFYQDHIVFRDDNYD
ncbi:uncharacterized protein LOC141533760 [Cotesia typhae]|uniref:uncharacterized protein LOC141533760 n=1 Tax=Cotesia typhae TaxID=2053667 RepID=UPI003D68BF6A